MQSGRSRRKICLKDKGDVLKRLRSEQQADGRVRPFYIQVEKESSWGKKTAQKGGDLNLIGNERSRKKAEGMTGERVIPLKGGGGIKSGARNLKNKLGGIGKWPPSPETEGIPGRGRRRTSDSDRCTKADQQEASSCIWGKKTVLSERNGR